MSSSDAMKALYLVQLPFVASKNKNSSKELGNIGYSSSFAKFYTGIREPELLARHAKMFRRDVIDIDELPREVSQDGTEKSRTFWLELPLQESWTG